MQVLKKCTGSTDDWQPSLTQVAPEPSFEFHSGSRGASSAHTETSSDSYVHDSQSSAESGGFHRDIANRRSCMSSCWSMLAAPLTTLLQARRAAQSRRETARAHMHGGTADTISRVIETAMETIMLDRAQYHATAFASSPVVHKSAGRHRAARRKLIKGMRSARIRITKLTAEAQGIATAVAILSHKQKSVCAQNEHARDVQRLQQAVQRRLQQSGGKWAMEQKLIHLQKHL